MHLSDFLFSRSRYYDQVASENIAFDAELQMFSLRVSYTFNLQTAEKLTPHEADQAVKAAWRSLKQKKKQLGLDLSRAV
ncbi:MAG: hypothetical protein HC873_13415 [Leptolyngbyaceae cyanobacterium SL_1_1]|nr:hypothetical protein [Leptolyngbyaceae cyanobacterium RM2_2_21]NJO10486.1 hypothetical protein [Leptolyngbyaceae cyanobacterium SL_1_1]